MKFSIFNFQFSILLFVFLFLFFNQIQAAGLVPCGGKGEPTCQLCHFFVLFKNIINFILWQIVPPVAVFMITVSGFFMIFSGGNPENIEKGKKIITNTLIGLVIIYATWAIINLFFQVIGVQNWTGLQNWWQIDCPI